MYKLYYTYILLCEDGSYYTGYTTDVQRRFEEHLSGKGAKYTRSHKPKGIIYKKQFKTRKEAMKYECEIKKLTHVQKENMIRKENNGKIQRLCR
jgi:putative endonuclease